VAGRLDRDAYVLELDERFTSKRLDASRWVPHYLPHWTTPERSAARFDMGNGLLRLRIDLDQPEWREADGGMRVSNLQTGTWSGPLGSARGQHRPRQPGRVHPGEAAAGGRDRRPAGGHDDGAPVIHRPPA